MEEKRTLHRGLGLWTAALAVMGSVIGSGVFKKTGPMTLELHSAELVLLAWILAGLVTLAGALANLEVAGLIAEPGGQYAFFRTMYGRLFAFLYGWSSFAVIESATIAGVGYIFAECVQEFVPVPRLAPSWEQLSVLGFFPLQNSGTKAVTITAILALTWVNRRRVMFGGYLSNLLTVFKVFGITLLILAGLALAGGHSDIQNPAAQPAHEYGRLGVAGAMFSAMLGAFWAYQGWNSVATLGGEVKDARRKIPLAILIGVLSVIVVYVLVNAVYFYILPAGEMERIARLENRIIAVEAVRAVAGQGGAKAITFLIMLSTLGTLHVTILTAARIYFAMGSDGIFFRGAALTHPVYRTPARALGMQGLWASLLVLTGSFDELTDRLIFAAFVFYGAGALGVFVLRRKMPEAVRIFKAFGYPVVPGLFVIFCAVLVVVTIIQSPRDAAIGLGLIFVGLPFYLFWARAR
ncbi:MAG: amino acid permease [Spirochaetia bacterium]|nr:amino acid permease [Spirochaetia bacterium]